MRKTIIKIAPRGINKYWSISHINFRLKLTGYSTFPFPFFPPDETKQRPLFLLTPKYLHLRHIHFKIREPFHQTEEGNFLFCCRFLFFFLLRLFCLFYFVWLSFFIITSFIIKIINSIIVVVIVIIIIILKDYKFIKFKSRTRF